LLATNDGHYVHQDDAVAHDALLCVQTNSTIDDPNRFKFSSDEHYLKTADEMRRLFDELPEACDNTLWIAERCNVEIEFGKPKLPLFPLPPGFEWIWFLTKVFLLLFFYIWMRWTLPRYRYDQLMEFGWKWLLPAAVVNLLVTAFAIIYFRW